MDERSEKVTLDNLVVFQRGELNMETVTMSARATVSDLVEALRETGVAIERKDHFVSWGKRFLVVPLGEDTE